MWPVVRGGARDELTSSAAVLGGSEGCSPPAWSLLAPDGVRVCGAVLLAAGRSDGWEPGHRALFRVCRMPWNRVGWRRGGPCAPVGCSPGRVAGFPGEEELEGLDLG